MTEFNADMIPEEIQSMLMDLAQTDEDVVIQIGKIVLTLINSLEQHQLEIPRMKVYKACGVWLKRPSETVRTCVYIAKNLPQEIYDRHSSVIGISQFKAMIPRCGTDPIAYDAMIEEWMDYCEETGMKASSVDGMRGWLSELEGGPNITYTRWGKMLRAMERCEGDPLLPDALRRAVKVSLKEITRQIDAWGLEKWRV